jgi:hypothetical protein
MFSGFRSLLSIKTEVRSQSELSYLPVDDVVLVAVVDARKHLLHKNCCVLFTEFAALQDFVEEFTALADPDFEISNGQS